MRPVRVGAAHGCNLSVLTPLEVARSGRTARFHGSWYRGPSTNFIPSKADLAEAGAVFEYVLKGWVPDRPLMDKTTAITAFGSCFASHITRYLIARGYAVQGQDLRLSSHLVRFGEGIVNSFAMLQQFEWALEDKPVSSGLWYSEDKEIVEVQPEVQANTRSLIRNTEVFIITLGLSEIWYDKLTGEAFWRAIPREFFDPDRHGFRVSTVSENLDNLRRVCDLVEKHRPGAKVIFTLSPVPLMATFRPVSCITASSVSKAILRVAIDELMREREGQGVFYFPSYEIVTDFCVDAFKDDNRHPKDEVVRFVMATFEQHYCARDSVTL